MVSGARRGRRHQAGAGRTFVGFGYAHGALARTYQVPDPGAVKALASINS